MLAIYNSAAFQTAAGVAVSAGAYIEVRREDTGALATIWQDEAGTVPQINGGANYAADAQGRFAFYAAGLARGYSVKATDPVTAETHTVHNQAIGTAAQYDADAALRTAIDALQAINSLTAETAPAVADLLGLYDASAAAYRKMTLENALKVINLLTADTSPDPTADYVVTFDASAAAAKKVLLGDLGAWEEISRQTVSAVASADFTLPAGYSVFCLTVIGVAPATDNVQPWLRFSDDNGSTFEADASDYSWTSSGAASSGIESSTGDTEIELRGAAGNAVAEALSMHIYIFDALDAAKRTAVYATGVTIDATGAYPGIVATGGAMNTASSDEAVRFMFSSGNIASGTLVLRGQK